MLILAIETSCDDTSCAVLEVTGGARSPKFAVRSSVVSSQIKVHAPYGGVVPTLAAREHVKNLPIVFQKTMKKAHVKMKDIDFIAVTQGPGLAIALLVGIQFARGLAYAYGKKIIPVNHIAGHIFSNWLLDTHVKFPLLNIVVSGGHTELILMKRIGDYKILGATRDDAAGEAFDKVAKMLGLAYPGGPVISELAKEGNSEAYALPRPMIGSKDSDFSFSGLKTAVLYLLKKEPDIAKNKKKLADLCASFEQAVADVIIAKTLKAARLSKAKTVALSGGVSANTRLRKQLQETFKRELPHVTVLIPEKNLTTDNAVMIAISAFFNKKTARSWKKLDANANLTIEETS
ncbi:tRNA (adenosine(37)-N6)-threonylcarbamoyltransferase complex transferase subunit TsaD [Candidatus Azambacteria bacterium RIFCSPLOWO2_01_FULL_46_25]|uniref:tRNA N6-adenosine threonylcarbamoyltransferase n=1 Tax=Candidatus Azambacteria bacterium RIFCSPLOWO2_01_FULL_46_25 TaxID=1797298 RepID=A0A1F5BV79_9BACT|nr:MAG: tRNA (adenosine(37)-N6)-threonylcarbamoyltransferase complex transferase subunit TsaD [Candidatus Azambacteria bacterium RIFCSPLOWO2_01_FULL_46_25]OGD36399.1 MAG: tRNA (adenosine(37)-N6)-threonylcarbamoyltransferase complex transferase subunit TsaD [Candidatus Azambacteria bacterium RIFCSPHIGHO2_01_FULL_51_74]